MEDHKIKITKNTTMLEQVQIPVEKSIPIIHDRSLSWHVTGTSINKNGDVKLVFFMKSMILHNVHKILHKNFIVLDLFLKK